MPDLTPYINFGIAGILLLLLVVLGIPIVARRMEARDKADQERRDRADKADQERRDRADQERREKEALLLQHLQATAQNAQRKLDEQAVEFLKALDRRDQQSEQQNARTVAALERLTAAVDALQRRQRS